MEEAWEFAALTTQATQSWLNRTGGYSVEETDDDIVSVSFPRHRAMVKDVEVTDKHLTVSLKDGRILSTPLEWYPRLKAAPQRFRDNWEIIAFGEGISWYDVNEDLHVCGMLAGSGGTKAELLSWEMHDEEGRYLLKPEHIHD